MKLKSVCAAALLALLTSACGSDEFSYEAGSYFAEDWAKSYTKVVSCKKSPTHGGDFVEIWADSQGAPLYGDLAAMTPQGTVVIKPQYSDDKCSQLSAITVMRKGAPGTAADKGDWEYQRVNGTGSIEAEGQVGACVSCHAGCSDKDYLCDRR